MAGQWLDVHIPALPNRIGGFTITSTPADASNYPKHSPIPPNSVNRKLVSSPQPYFELAIQKSPKNPPADWLWKDPEEILDQSVDVRVGGSFVWPPKGKSPQTALFVAGGVGIKYVPPNHGGL